MAALGLMVFWIVLLLLGAWLDTSGLWFRILDEIHIAKLVRQSKKMHSDLLPARDMPKDFEIWRPAYKEDEDSYSPYRRLP